MQALHESSINGCHWQRYGNFICVAVNGLRERSYCFRYESLLFAKPGLTLKFKKKTTLRQLTQIIISSSRYKGKVRFRLLVHMKTMIYNNQRSVYKKNACLISPFPFITIWSIHSIDEIKRYADRTLHKNCSKPSRHSVALTILHYRDRSGRVANSMFSGDARPSSALDDLPGGSKRRGWIPVEDCPILRILQVLLHPNNRTKR